MAVVMLRDHCSSISASNTNRRSGNKLNNSSYATGITPTIRHSPLQLAMQKIAQLNNTVNEQSREIACLREELNKERRLY